MFSAEGPKLSLGRLVKGDSDGQTTKHLIFNKKSLDEKMAPPCWCPCSIISRLDARIEIDCRSRYLLLMVNDNVKGVNWSASQ